MPNKVHPSSKGSQETLIPKASKDSREIYDPRNNPDDPDDPKFPRPEPPPCSLILLLAIISFLCCFGLGLCSCCCFSCGACTWDKYEKTRIRQTGISAHRCTQCGCCCTICSVCCGCCGYICLITIGMYLILINSGNATIAKYTGININNFLGNLTTTYLG